MSVTVRTAKLVDGSEVFDEIFAQRAYVHVEVMARLDDTDGEHSHLWMVIEAGGKRVTLNVSSTSEMKYLVETEDMPEVPR